MVGGGRSAATLTEWGRKLVSLISRGTRAAALSAVAFRTGRQVNAFGLDQALKLTRGIHQVNFHTAFFSTSEELTLERGGIILSVKVRSIFAGKRRGIGGLDRHQDPAAGLLVCAVDGQDMKELEVCIGADPMHRFHESHIERDLLVDEIPGCGEEVLCSVFRFRPERCSGCEQDEDRGDEGLFIDDGTRGGLVSFKNFYAISLPQEPGGR